MARICVKKVQHDLWRSYSGHASASNCDRPDVQKSGKVQSVAFETLLDVVETVNLFEGI
jgi:hypothetical protein